MKHPERFKEKIPISATLPNAIGINGPVTPKSDLEAHHAFLGNVLMSSSLSILFPLANELWFVLASGGGGLYSNEGETICQFV